MGRRGKTRERRKGSLLVLVYLMQHILHVALIYVALVDFAKQLLARRKSKACIASRHCGGFASTDGK